ncbi:MAG: hypothetical protein PHG31_04460 [Candidatus Omnitrophica bacterium]|nr:hypothetical protein [Candidatus Omnitrophota bacterium]
MPGKRIGDCWDFWKCPKELKEACPVYIAGLGQECWFLAPHLFPKTKRSCAQCPECAWYKLLA